MVNQRPCFGDIKLTIVKLVYVESALIRTNEGENFIPRGLKSFFERIIVSLAPAAILEHLSILMSDGTSEFN